MLILRSKEPYYMQLHLLTPEEYKNIYADPLTVYTSVEFSLLNEDKTYGLVFLSLCEGDKHLLGIILGRKGNAWFSPFSAPFGGFSSSGHLTAEIYIAACEAVRWFAAGREVRVVPAPQIYGGEGSVGCAYALAPWADASALWIGHAYPLAEYPHFADRLPARKRRYLRAAEKAGAEFRKAPLEEAYSIVRRHHESKGYPLRMTLEGLAAMKSLVEVDSFVLEEEGIPVAAAIVYRHSDRIAQVIYWCHIPEGERDHTMLALASGVFGHYYEAGLELVDLGPSSCYEDPNPGLCAFKESLGCFSYLKPSYLLR